MTAKEKLRELVEAFSEPEASEALRLLGLRTDPVVVAFRDAPLDDGPLTVEDPRAGARGLVDPDISSGHALAIDELKRLLGDE